VERFLATRGESRLVTLRTERDEASANLEFEAAAAIHAQIQRVESVRGLAAELVRPLSQLRALVLQASAEPDEVAVFVFEGGRMRGPVGFSTIGMRIQNEQSGSSSLYAQPMAIEPVVEVEGTGTRDEGTGARDEGTGKREQGTENTETLQAETQTAELRPPVDAQRKLARGVLETRLEEALAKLGGTEDLHSGPPSSTERQGHLALLKRWYYRPEVRRTGEVFFPGEDGAWPSRAILRGIGRVAAKALANGPRPAQTSQ
jgi:hypothetical protein